METTIVDILKGKYNLSEILEYLNYLKDDIKFLLDIIKNIEKEYLFKSKIHGFNHSVRVMLFTYIIAKKQSLSKINTKILIDAALYHDIGRQSNNEDTIHGLSSAYLINKLKVVKHPIYQKGENLNLLKAIIDGHSRPDNDMLLCAADYEIHDVERFIKLYNVIKDADALDRKRFREGFNFSFNKDFLRTKEAKELINLSDEINKIYKAKLQEIEPNFPKEKVEKDCIHSIGFDFFKLESILKYGILSKSKINKLSLKIPPNFDGGNLDNWISVVDPLLIKDNYTGFKEFVKNGISFYCTINHLEEGLGVGNQDKALEEGLPYNKGYHKDEKYVYQEIPNTNILSIIIPKSYINRDILTLDYIFNSMDPLNFQNRIMYYLEKTNSSNKDLKEINEYINQYIEILIKYNTYHNICMKIDGVIEKEDNTINYNNLPSILEPIRKKINSAIQKWVKNYYSIVLKKNQINVSDVVMYELTKSNFTFSALNTNDELLIIIQNNLLKGFEKESKEDKISHLKN